MLTHVNEKNLPTMVDVSSKRESLRMAIAQSLVQFPPEIREHVRDGEIYLKKGPVFQTAIIAGTMAVKKTSEMIPFCHQILIESCKIDINLDENLCVRITCKVVTHGKTGVEMEALHGSVTASIAIYDMCKVLSHDIQIKETKLLAKTGGKNTFLDRPLYGLVLTGGKSTRMKRDKALIPYRGKPHAQFIYEILARFCKNVYLSASKDQWLGTPLAQMSTIEDLPGSRGPIAGILSAFATHPDANWFVVACDLVHFNAETVENLLANYDPHAIATCYRNRLKGFPEPLCTLYTPKALSVFSDAKSRDITCPVKILSQSSCHVIDQGESVDLLNVNMAEEYEEVRNENN